MTTNPFITSTTLTGTSYTSPTYTITSNGTSPIWQDTLTLNSNQRNQLDVKGDANFHGDITLQGVSLKETLENIEKRLAILHPNIELEEKWENLKGLRQAYMELEAEILEKEKVWKILKK